MPRLASHTGSRVLERLVLQAVRRKTNVGRHGKESLAVRRHEMRHQAPLPDVTMEPESTVHGVEHTVTPALELTPRRFVRPPRLRKG